MRLSIPLSITIFLLLTFREPLSAQQSPTTPSSTRQSFGVRNSAPDLGSIVAGVYRNSVFQFAYQIPFGWVDRTSDIRDQTETGKAKVLLAVFERPPATVGKTVNAAVIVAAERTDSYPGLKTGADYFGPLSELIKSKGFKVVNGPYEFPVDGRAVFREDFIKDMGSVVMHQSSLAMISRGYALSFTFIAGSDDDVTGLIEQLRFAPAKNNSAR